MKVGQKYAHVYDTNMHCMADLLKISLIIFEEEGEGVGGIWVQT